MGSPLSIFYSKHLFISFLRLTWKEQEFLNSIQTWTIRCLKSKLYLSPEYHMLHIYGNNWQMTTQYINVEPYMKNEWILRYGLSHIYMWMKWWPMLPTDQYSKYTPKQTTSITRVNNIREVHFLYHSQSFGK